MARVAAISLLVFLVGGCATVYPQPKPPQPVAIYVLDYGIHSGLLLPNGDGRYVEYCFGDWNYAALNHCWPQDAVGALLVSFQSALGRRYVTVHPGQSRPYPCHPEPEKVQMLYASQLEVAKVVKELDARYQHDAKQELYNPDNLTFYVKDPEHYSLANNCNHLTARCLREMGCEVHGIVVLSKFAVAPVPAKIVKKPIDTAASPARVQSATAN